MWGKKYLEETFLCAYRLQGIADKEVLAFKISIASKTTSEHRTNSEDLCGIQRR